MFLRKRLCILVLTVITTQLFLAWRNGYWKVRGRLFYSLLVVWLWAGLWALHYWNLLL